MLGDNLGKIKSDSRITFIGKFMRKYFIDEFPQIYDLCVGTLSLVGIRPRSKEDWSPHSNEHKQRAWKYKPDLFGVNYYSKDF